MVMNTAQAIEKWTALQVKVPEATNETKDEGQAKHQILIRDSSKRIRM
jgi:hypothetical protein